MGGRFCVASIMLKGGGGGGGLEGGTQMVENKATSFYSFFWHLHSLPHFQQSEHLNNSVITTNKLYDDKILTT